MITPIARVPALLNGKPVVVIGFDATHALVVDADGELSYVEHRDIQVSFFRDLEVGLWFDYGEQVGQTDVGPDDGVQPAGTQQDAETPSRAD